MATKMGSLIEVGTNLIELIDFRLYKEMPDGKIKEQIYGINVFKVKEVIFLPEQIMRVNNASSYLEGMINLRGQAIPIINLVSRIGIEGNKPIEYLIITEFNNIICGFMVHDIKKIRRISWDRISEPPDVIREEYGNIVTSVTLIDNNEIMLILDFEKIIAEVNPSYIEQQTLQGKKNAKQYEVPEGKKILVVDDSSIARKMVTQTLSETGSEIFEKVNGQDALDFLLKLAEKAKLEKNPLSDYISLVLSDVEMPKMDGFTLTKTIKNDPLLKDIPVILHTSLSGGNISAQGLSVGADDFLVKFDADHLLETVAKILK